MITLWLVRLYHFDYITIESFNILENVYFFVHDLQTKNYKASHLNISIDQHYIYRIIN